MSGTCSLLHNIIRICFIIIYFIIYPKLSIDRKESSAIVIWVDAKMHKNN